MTAFEFCVRGYDLKIYRCRKNFETETKSVWFQRNVYAEYRRRRRRRARTIRGTCFRGLLILECLLTNAGNRCHIYITLTQLFFHLQYQYTNDTYPVIVFIHGGRFQTGSGSDIPQRAILSNFVSRKASAHFCFSFSSCFSPILFILFSLIFVFLFVSVWDVCCCRSLSSTQKLME